MQSTQKNIKNNNLLININKLNVFFNTPEGLSHVVKDVNFNVKKGTCLGVVGESGSGKTQTFFSITGLLAKNGYAEGEANFKDYNLITCDDEIRRGFLGKSIGFIFQDPMTSLTPHLKIGDGAVLTARSGVTKDIEDGDQVAGFPAISKRQFWREQAALRRLGTPKASK